MQEQPDKQDICVNCGHKYLFHISNFKGECDVCDDPTIPIEKKCPGFKQNSASAWIDSLKNVER